MVYGSACKYRGARRYQGIGQKPKIYYPKGSSSLVSESEEEKMDEEERKQKLQAGKEAVNGT